MIITTYELGFVVFGLHTSVRMCVEQKPVSYESLDPLWERRAQSVVSC
jgi:hypothetical protein